ncbi:MAG: LysR family transcriptional regulator [Eubacteriales bacterium]|nr:LysR family transcriptional regulator [Eubacteriales bacterium]
MELRILQYFLAVTREANITAAAETLHLSQPALSRQLKDMEEELGKQLLIRGNRGVTLTTEGMILRKRAEEIMELVRKTEREIALSDEYIAGDITVGAGETDGVRFLVQTVKMLQEQYPDIHLHIVSGDGETVEENLDRGLIDFGFLCREIDTAKYEYLRLPGSDSFGVLMRKDAPLAEKEAIAPENLWDKPLIVSRQALGNASVGKMLKCRQEKLNIVASYNLLFNGSIMVDEGMGYALCFDHIINVSGDSNLCFRPLLSSTESPHYVVWKKYQTFTKAAEKFLTKMQELAEQS